MQFCATSASASLLCLWGHTCYVQFFKRYSTETTVVRRHVKNVAVDKWLKSLCFCVSAKGGHFAYIWRCC